MDTMTAHRNQNLMLDKLAKFPKDLQAVYDSVAGMPDQCADALHQAKSIKLPAAYKKCKQVIVAGMGGSNLGVRLIRAVYKSTCPFPIELVNDYTLPAYAGKQTLVIASSYSGSTEETLMVAQQAHKKGCKVIVMATGGRLVEWAKHYKLPVYQFVPLFNPSHQPRLGIGYSLFTLLAIFKQLGLKISDKELTAVIAHLKALVQDWAAEQPMFANRPKQIASELKGFIPLYVMSEHLHGNGRIACNQTHETAKSFAATFALPELNHHLMEGLKHPSRYSKGLKVIALRSDQYPARVQARYDITRSVVEQNTIEWIDYRPTAKTKLGEACECVLFSGFLTMYLAILYKENPVAVPWVDFFKRELSKMD
jgi:glucose/mannose-6-phosphate isomerase